MTKLHQSYSFNRAVQSSCRLALLTHSFALVHHLYSLEWNYITGMSAHLCECVGFQVGDSLCPLRDEVKSWIRGSRTDIPYPHCLGRVASSQEGQLRYGELERRGRSGRLVLRPMQSVQM